MVHQDDKIQQDQSGDLKWDTYRVFDPNYTPDTITEPEPYKLALANTYIKESVKKCRSNQIFVA